MLQMLLKMQLVAWKTWSALLMLRLAYMVLHKSTWGKAWLGNYYDLLQLGRLTIDTGVAQA